MEINEIKITEKDLETVNGGRVSYRRLRKHFQDQNLELNVLVEEGIITPAELICIQNDSDCDPSLIDRLCRDLQCTPGDIVEYLPDA